MRDGQVRGCRRLVDELELVLLRVEVNGHFVAYGVPLPLRIEIIRLLPVAVDCPEVALIKVDWTWGGSPAADEDGFVDLPTSPEPAAELASVGLDTL